MASNMLAKVHSSLLHIHNSNILLRKNYKDPKNPEGLGRINAVNTTSHQVESVSYTQHMCGWQHPISRLYNENTKCQE